MQSYPKEFLERIKAQLGAEYEAFIESLQEPSPTSLRLNPKKAISKFDEEERVPWCADGRYLKERPSFTFDPLFHAGAYYVQEASSMFIEHVWKQINPDNSDVKVLDISAAPGGKSTHLLSLLSEGSLLVSNEIIPNRNKILQQNIIKWGSANCIITQNKAESFSALENYFDLILVDAPCSGEGLFRKDKDAIDEWSERNVELCAIRQRDILKQILPCLKPGGFLIYCTCTFEESENDQNIKALINDEDIELVDLNVPAGYKLRRTDFGYQFYPHKVKGEGFYISVLRKSGESREASIRISKTETVHDELLTRYLREAQKFQLLRKDLPVRAESSHPP